jgi:single-strand DNA-binding protein
MANLNKVMLIGRLTRDPEVRTFANGGKVANFGFAVNNKKKNTQTGQWEDEPVWLDVEAFNRTNGQQQADLIEQSLRKGSQVFIEGHLKLDQWTDKENQKRQKLKIVVDNFQFLDSRAASEAGGAPRANYASRRPAGGQSTGGAESYDQHEGHDPSPPMDLPPPGRAEEDIPF